MGGTEIKNGSRYNPHILIVGDPGLGKSQLLQAATLVAPRGICYYFSIIFTCIVEL